VERLSDEELMAQAQNGNVQAVDLLVSRHYGLVLNFAYRMLGSRETAADVAQKTFTRVFASARTFKIGKRFKTWLCAITANLCRDELRAKAGKKEASLEELQEMAGDAFAAAGTAPDAADEAALRILGEELWEKVRALPDKMATPLILHYRDGLTFTEIAEVMKVPVGSAKSWTFHAIRRLRAELTGNGLLDTEGEVE
jgi:RNA polymerase sigma-70 factor (ECF subfamily)